MRILLFMALMAAQQFEVASVRPSEPEPRRPGTFDGFPRSAITPNGVSLGNMDLFSIILMAYDIPQTWAITRLDTSKFRGPDSILGKQFNIEARGTGDMKAMLRHLLASRFGLKTHPETRLMPLYALRVKEPGRLGPNLKVSKENCAEWLKAGGRKERPRPEPCSTAPLPRTRRGAGSITELVGLAQAALREPVVDETGLTGNFEWEVMFDRPGSTVAPTLPDAFEDQLGLKLERTKGPWQVLVIDDVKMPTPN